MTKEDKKPETDEKPVADEPTEFGMRFVGSHSEEDASGRTLEPGEFYTFTSEALREGHNEQLVADGKLLGVDGSAEHEVKLAIRRASSVKEDE